MRTITSFDDLYANIARLEKYRTAPKEPEYAAYQALVKRGTCFFPYLAGDEICFAPSRFIGYENNDIDSHLRNATKDGRVTNEAINSVLSAQPVQHIRLEAAYRNFCYRLEVMPNPTGNFGAPRRYWITDETESILDRTTLEELTRDASMSDATRMAIIQARVGQGVFRQKLIERWKTCSVTGCTLLTVLRASHIKPWAESTNEEKLDEFNGLLLTANLDALFDKGLISFLDDGTMITSGELSSNEESLLLGGYTHKKVNLSVEHARYLAYHRLNVFVGPERMHNTVTNELEQINSD